MAQNIPSRPPPCAARAPDTSVVRGTVEASALPWPAVTTHAPEPSTRASAGLDVAQVDGFGDMPADALRAVLHQTADLVADYLSDVERYAVLPRIAPGELTARLDGPAPEEPDAMEAILADVEREVLPNVTHWQHPAFFAYFASSASGPGLVGEALMAGLNANAMLWRTSPVGTELEAITVGWLREGLGLPPTFDGLFTDTASTSTLSALAAARELATGDAAERGLSGSSALTGRRGLRVYASREAHSSVDKAAMTLGLGRDGVRKIDVDRDLALDPVALGEAIAEDRAAGWLPCAVVSTVGTTSSTAIDPVAAVAAICEREGVWHHVDAAYAGAVALIPEQRGPFHGWERADSIVVNPHKWLFTPLDCSLLLTRRPELLRAAFSLVPEYLRTTGGAGADATTTSTSRSSAGAPDRSRCGSSCATSDSPGCVAASRRISTLRPGSPRRSMPSPMRSGSRPPRSRRCASAGVRRGTAGVRTSRRSPPRSTA